MIATATDCHAHVFTTGMPLAPVRRYAPTYDRTSADYLAALDAHDLARGVLVQPSFYGTDNTYLVQSLHTAPDRLRGIAVVSTEISPKELNELHRANVVGIRLNLEGLDLPTFEGRGWSRLLEWIVANDWQIEINRRGADWPYLLDRLLPTGVTVVVDHFGRPTPSLGVADPGFQYLLDAAAESNRIWMKVSGVYRLESADGNMALAQAAAASFADRVGTHRMVWGSDWPHTQFESQMTLATTLQHLIEAIPDPGVRDEVLGPNPATLYRFSS